MVPGRMIYYFASLWHLQTQKYVFEITFGNHFLCVPLFKSGLLLFFVQSTKHKTSQLVSFFSQFDIQCYVIYFIHYEFCMDIYMYAFKCNGRSDNKGRQKQSKTANAQRLLHLYFNLPVIHTLCLFIYFGILIMDAVLDYYPHIGLTMGYNSITYGICSRMRL